MFGILLSPEEPLAAVWRKVVRMETALTFLNGVIVAIPDTYVSTCIGGHTLIDSMTNRNTLNISYILLQFRVRRQVHLVIELLSFLF